MIRISKMTDYATVLLAELARAPQTQQSAATLAERTQIAVPTVSKALKALQRAGLVRSTLLPSSMRSRVRSPSPTALPAPASANWRPPVAWVARGNE